jgi:SAM-dependent methyltransferase
MDIQALEALQRRELACWWRVTKRHVILSLLEGRMPRPERVFVLGCGGGRLTAILRRHGWEVIAADADLPTVRCAQEAATVQGLVIDPRRPWPLTDKSVNAVVIPDMLAAMEDDAACLAQARRILAVGGCLVLTAPAYPSLFARRDRASGRVRRYSRHGLKTLLTDQGFRLIRVSHWNLPGILPALYLRLCDRLAAATTPPCPEPSSGGFLNPLLTIWGEVESQILWSIGIPLPTGLNLVVLAEKRKE